MTASEKLRALHEEGERVSSESGMPGLKYLNSHHDLLPLIADVVEAAEDLAGYDWHALKHIVGGEVGDMRAMEPEDAEELKESRRKAHAALTALREHLEGK